MTLADFVRNLRERAWTQSVSRGSGPVTRDLVNRLVDRAICGLAPTPEQDTLAQILDALRVPERATELPDNSLDRLTALTVLELEVLVDQMDRGLITSGQISDALRRARIHTVPPDS